MIILQLFGVFGFKSAFFPDLYNFFSLQGKMSIVEKKKNTQHYNNFATF